MPSSKQNLIFLLDLLRANAGMAEDDLFIRLKSNISKGLDPTDEDWTELRERVRAHTQEFVAGGVPTDEFIPGESGYEVLEVLTTLDEDPTKDTP